MDLRTVIFYGPSGSGKGTQALLLKAYLEKNDPAHKVLYIETGEQFRGFMAKDNFTARLVKKVVGEGGLLPEFLPIWVWVSFLVDHYTGAEHLILDGLARRPDEAPVLEHALMFYERPRPDVVVLNVSRAWVLERLNARGRHDDTEQEVDRRLSWYEEQVRPASEYLESTGKFSMHQVNGEQTIEGVHKDIVKALFEE